MGILPFESPERVFGNRRPIFKKAGGLYIPRLGQASKGRRVSLLETSKNRGIVVHWVSRHLPRGSGRDQGLWEPFQRARRPWQAVDRGGCGGMAELGEGQGFLPGLGRAPCQSEGPGFVLLRGSSPSQIWELVGAFGRSWPTRQRYVRILPGKPEGGGSSNARLPAPANGEACTVRPRTPGSESTLCHVQAW